MSLINIQALDEQVLQREPFDYLVVPNFISREALGGVNTDFPVINTAANHNLDHLRYGAAFSGLLEEIQGQPFAAALGEKFDMELGTLPTTITVRKYCERTDGNIHTDHKSKVLTVLVYFNEEWKHAEGKLRLLHSPDRLDDYAEEVEPLGGTLLAFKRTDHSWHGHSQFVGERRMMQLNYLHHSAWSVMNQRLSRFGTQFMKNVLGMR
jgi:SM-20-related protein